MKNFSLTTIYQKIIRNIRVLVGYTEEPDYEFIIKACRLKPFDYYFNNARKKIVLHRKWFDEYGNSFLLNGKIPEILFGDVEMLGKYNVCTDIYEGLDIVRTKKISKLVCLFQGKILEQDIFYISFLGIDNYLRTFVIYEDKIEKISSLYLGMGILKQISENIDIKYFTKLKLSKSKLPPSCESGLGWLSYLPMHKDFEALIKNNFEQLSSIF